MSLRAERSNLLKSVLTFLGIFVFGLIWFLLFIPWNGFPDPDAFYHAHISKLFWESGPIRAFPWLDLTSLATSWTDHHFLFHAIEAPFVAFFGWANGARITAVMLASIFLTATYASLRWMNVRSAFVWPFVLAFTPVLVLRLVLAKASPLALTFFVLGLAAAWKRKLWIVSVIAALFALSHGGWIFLVGSVGLLAFGDALHRHIVDGMGWREIVRVTLWPEVLAAIAGAVFGTIIHPNFPANLSFLWTQVITIGLGTPYDHVILGSEWRPAELFDVIGSFTAFLVAGLLGGLGLLLARRREFDRDAARASTSFAWVVAALLAMTFKSQRNAEYLAPALALWIPWFWQLGDVRKVLSAQFSVHRKKIMTYATGVFVAAAVGISLARMQGALHNPPFKDEYFRSAMAAVSERAEPGDRVFHSDWDEFPLLWNIDDRLRYVAGLDPTFLYVASSSLSDAYRDVTWKTASSSPSDVWDFTRRIDARFVFVAKSDHAALIDLIRNDSRYELLADTEDAATFEVKR